MTPRENLLRVLRHERPEWIPLTAHVDLYNQPSQAGMDPALQRQLQKVEWGDESIVRFSRWLGLDIADFTWSPTWKCRYRRVSIEKRTDGANQIAIWHTPAGDLREVVQQTREDGTSYTVEHFVKGPEDLPALAAMFEDEVWEPADAPARAMAARRALIGDDGVSMYSLPGTPLGMMYREFCSVETLAYLWADARSELHELFAIMERHYRRQYELAAQLDVDVLIGMDDTSTTVISPAMFEECNLELTNQRADRAHAAGKFYFHHSCGLIKDLLPIYRQTRMDAVHAFTVPPIGNVTVAEGRRLLGDRIAIWTVPHALADNAWNPAAVRASIQQMYEGAGDGAAFIMCICAYPHRTMEQTKFIVDCCRECGYIPHA